MTYCLGWKTNKGIIIAADAAITGSNQPSASSCTSFYEPHVVLPDGRRVDERSLKTFHISDRLVLTYAGKVCIAEKFIETVRRATADGLPPSEAVRHGLVANIDPAAPQIGIIYGFYEDGIPRLMSYNISRPFDFDEHETLVQGGSIPFSVKSLTENYLKQCDDDTDSLTRQLSKILGVLQAYGAMGPLIHTRAGGVFSVLGLDSSGFHVQPDVLFTFHGKDKGLNVNTAVFARHDCIVAKPNVKSWLCLMNRNFGEDDQAALARGHSACTAADAQYDKGKFDFVIFHNIDTHAVVIVEMSKKKKHNLLWIEPFVVPAGSGLAIFLHPKLSHMKDAESNYVFFLPYELPEPDCPIRSKYKEYKAGAR